MNSTHSEKSSLVDRFIHKYGRLPTEVDPDYLEMLRMSKYKVEDVPMFKPGVCANCGSSKGDDRKYIDFGLEIDWHGIIYLCTICMEDIAKSAGLFIKYQDVIAELTLKIQELEKKLQQGVELPDKLVKAWEEFKEYYASIQSASDNIVSAIPNSPPDNSVVQSTNEAESDKQRTTVSKSRATKSTSSPRRSDIPSLASLLDSSK